MGRINTIKNRLSFQATKRRINLIFTQFGVSLALGLLLIQIQTTALSTGSTQPESWFHIALSTIEPVTKIIINVFVNPLTQGGL